MSDNIDAFEQNWSEGEPAPLPVEEAKAAVAEAADQVASFDPIGLAHDLGVRSRHAYIGGFASIALALVVWVISRVKPTDSKGQSDRWGIFVGHWAPTFFAVGLALKTKERD